MDLMAILRFSGFDSHCSLGFPKPQLSSLAPWRDGSTWCLEVIGGVR